MLGKFVVGVDLVLDVDTQLDAKMKITMKPTDVVFTFLDAQDRPIASDLLSGIEFIRRSAETSLMMTFSGSSLSRCVVFRKQADFDRVLQSVKKRAIVTMKGEDTLTLYLERKTDTMVDRISALFRQGRTAVEDTMVLKVFPSVQLQEVTPQIAETMNLAEESLAMMDIEQSAFAVIMDRILGCAECIDEYKMLKKQWQLTSRDQWNRDVKLRAFVKVVEDGLMEAQMAEPARVMCFNVCMAMGKHYCGKMKSNEQVFCIAENVVNAFVTSTNSVRLKGGRELVGEAAESAIFASTRRFVDFADKGSDPVSLWGSIHAFLEYESPEALEIMNELGINSFDFGWRESLTFFTKGRSRTESLLLILSAALAESIDAFNIAMVSSILVLLKDRLKMTLRNGRNVYDGSRLENGFSSHLREIPTRLLILNCTRLLAIQRE